MSFKAITVYTPPEAEPHICAEDDAFIHASLCRCGSGVLGGLECTVVDDTLVRLSGGGVINKGYIMYIPAGESHDLTVAAGTQSLKRHDLVVAEFSRGGDGAADVHEFKVITGTASASPSDPQLISSDLISAGDVNQVALFRLVFNGLTLSSAEPLAPQAGGRPDYIRCAGSSGTITPESAVITKVPVTSTGAVASGNSFSVSGGAICCKAAGTVEVAGSVYMSGTADAGSYYGCYIKKNETELTPGIRSAVIEGAVSAPTQTVSVEAGDEITLYCRTTCANGACLGGSNATWLSVKYI